MIAKRTVDFAMLSVIPSRLTAATVEALMKWPRVCPGVASARVSLGSAESCVRNGGVAQSTATVGLVPTQPSG